MAKFIGLTAGLQTSAGLIKAEFYRTPEGVDITAVSANNLSRVKSAGKATVSEAEFADRPVDPYDNLAEARWAFGKLGIEV